MVELCNLLPFMEQDCSHRHMVNRKLAERTSDKKWHQNAKICARRQPCPCRPGGNPLLFLPQSFNRPRYDEGGLSAGGRAP